MGLRVYSDVTLNGHTLKATVYENVGGGTGSAGTDDWGNSYDNKRTWTVPDGDRSWVMPGISGDADSDYWVELRQQLDNGSAAKPEVNSFVLDVPAKSSTVIFYDEDPTVVAGTALSAKDKSLFWDTDVDWANAQEASNVTHGPETGFNPWTETGDTDNEEWYLGARNTGTGEELNFAGDLDEVRLYDIPLSEYEIYATEQVSKGSNGVPLVGKDRLSDGGLIRYSMDDADIENGTLIDTWNTADATINGVTTGVSGVAQTESFEFTSSSNLSTSYETSFGGGDFTVSAWIYSESWGSEAVVTNYNSNSNKQGFICEILSGDYRFWIDNGDDLQTNISPPTGQWVHVVWVRRNGTQYIYENATSIASQASSNSVDTTNDPLYLGSRGGGGNQLTGKIDEVRIYDRGITEQEIQSLYQYTGPVGIARYTMDNITDSTLPDVWNNNDGTIVGATVDNTGPDTTSALSFDGNDYVNLVNPPIQKDFTFATNLYWDGTDRGYIFVGEINGSEGEFQLIVDGSGKLQWKLRERGGTGVISASSQISSGTWYHVVGIADANARKIYLYVDAIEEGSAKAIGSTRQEYNNLNGSVSLGYPDTDENGDNLQTFYHLDEESGSVAYDATENLNDGAVLGATQGEEGLLNSSCYYFDAIDDAIDTSITLGSQFTISVWVKKDDSHPLYPQVMGKEEEFTMGVRSDEPWKFLVSDSSSTWSTLVANTTLDINRWYHLCVTYDNGTTKMYVDGELDKQGTLASYTLSTDFYIGRRKNQTDDYMFKGHLDSIRFYDRVLSDAEVYEDLYDITNGYITTDARLL